MQLLSFWPRLVVLMLLCIGDGEPERRGLGVAKASRRTRWLGSQKVNSLRGWRIRYPALMEGRR